MTALIDAAIRFEQVNYTADGVPILNNITGSLPKGEITTLVGPSGAGKTTLFRLCNGLISPNSGTIYIDDKNSADYHPVTLRRHVGMALQSATMIDGTVKDNLALPLTLQGKTLPDKDAQAFLQSVGLDAAYLNRDSKDLSGGQQQKLSIARTLVNRPEILLLDEVTSSLDLVSEKDIEALIVRIKQNDGVTVVWVTHSLEQALNVGTYTWVLMDGQLVESGTSDLLNNPHNARVRRFVEGEVE